MIRFLTRPGRLLRLQLLTLFLLILSSTLALYINYKNKELSEQLVIDQVQNRQLVLARAGASSIEWFFKTLTSEIGAMSQISAVQSHDLSATGNLFQSFIKRYISQPFLAINLMDANGKLLLAENKLGIKSSQGQNFSDRDYFLWAKDPASRGKVRISDPFISRAGMTKGKMIIALITPIYTGSKFNGAVLLISELDGFVGQFINPLRVTHSNQAFIIDSSNIIIGAEDSKFNGRKLEDIAINNRGTGLTGLMAKLESRESEDGTIEWTGQYVGTESTENLTAYKRFLIGEKYWTIIISAPKHSIQSLLLAFMPFDALSLILIVSCTFLAGVIFIVTVNASQLHGFKKALRKLQSS